jgi:uncharacterized protein YdhG (YjbR/CyaY superfamily)
MLKKKSPRAKTIPKTVEEYLASVPEPGRGALKKLRAIVRSVVPREASETISYRIPAIRYKGVLLWFAAFSDHVSLFPTASVIRIFQKDLKTYETSKGTVRFPVSKPLPVTLVKKMIKARLAQVENK